MERHALKIDKVIITNPGIGMLQCLTAIGVASILPFTYYVTYKLGEKVGRRKQHRKVKNKKEES